MARPRNPNSRNVHIAIGVFDEMTALVRLWDQQHRHLVIPFATQGGAITTRLNFHIWRKEAPQMYPQHPDVLMAQLILCRKPILFEDSWYLEFVERSKAETNLASFLRSHNVPPPSAPALIPPPEPVATATATAKVVEVEKEDPDAFLREWLKKKD